MAYKQKTLIIGAGPVGSLAALYAAVRGHEVEIYELRSDLRDPSTVPLNFTKSINLALSERGINSMRKANRPKLLETVLNETIPMQGRMIHSRKNGQLFEQPQLYDVHGRFIRAVDRHGLNKRLLDELESMPNVTFFFNHKLTGADFKRNTAWFERNDDANRGKEVEVQFDFLIGADGAHSSVRYHLMKFSRLAYQQQYIDTLWCEFTIPPAPGGGFRMSPNHLHIWPCGTFMFIAIPSLDETFTCTMFQPEAQYAYLDENPDKLVEYFEENFPGVVPDLIKPEELREQYDTNPHLPLISIKCTPYHYGSSAVIVGDAAHAMVPFYGQGMNAGLEDVRVLFDTLDQHTGSATDKESLRKARGEALAAYTRHRTPDAASINDLALRNYQEMRSDVRSSYYKFRKWLEEKLDAYIPSLGWATQYSRVSFSNERYSEVLSRAKRQGDILSNVLNLTFVSSLGWLGWTLWKLNKVPDGRRLLANALNTALSKIGK